MPGGETRVLTERYELEERIASGGMGEVHRARDRRLGRAVAVKILPPDRIGDAIARERLLREAKAAASLEHPGIVHVYDVGETGDGGAYLVMELVLGASLRRHVEAKSATPVRVVGWLLEAARALGAAHARGLVHRDVKPDNLMIREDGRVVVLDFGLAKADARARGPGGGGAGGATTQLTDEGVIVGTPAYLAPEQAESRPIDARADQFALGVTAYEALTGRVPWRSTSAAAVLAEILRDEPPPASSVNPALPAALDAVLARAMAKRPEDRYASADAFADALAEVHRGMGGESAAHAAPVSLAPTEAIERPCAPTPQRTRAALAADLQTSRGRGRAAAWWSLMAGVGLVGVLGAVALAVRLRPHTVPVAIDAAPAPAPSVVATAVTDVPIPPSPNPEALAAYRAGMQATRDGAPEGIRRNFQRAVELDPTYGAAYYRLGDILFGIGESVAAREAFEKARAFRAAMPERERLLLQAEEPMVLGSPPDNQESIRRVGALIERFPGDSEIAGIRAYIHFIEGDYEKARVDARRSVALDPANAISITIEAWALENQGKKEEAMRAYEACLAVTAGATQCWVNHALLASAKGDCATFAADADRMIGANPHYPPGFQFRTSALLLRGAARDAVDEAARQWRVEGSEPFDPYVEPSVALARGDFAVADRRAAEAERRLAAERTLQPHVLLALRRVQALLELGRRADATRVALGLIDRVGVWEPAGGPINDQTLRVVGDAARAGAISPAAKRAARDVWLARWQRSDPGPKTLKARWLWGDAILASTRDEAVAALAAMPAGAGPDDGFATTMALGELYLLVGRTDEAAPLFERTASWCDVVDEPYVPVVASLRLGQARESLGDVPRACAAYQLVLDRWGAAPVSASASLARARRRALGCK
jgi:serine/threonine-protein kinase